jgi:CheY-like chemotaxis protein
MVDQVVLIVEDEPALLRLFTTVVSHIVTNHTVHSAAGGPAALSYLQQHTPKLILLDMAMPHVGGNEVIDYIIQQPRMNDTIILIITAVPHRLREDLRDRVTAILAKPITPRELERMILPYLS